MNEEEKFSIFLKESDVVLVQFYASWYKPCVALQPIFEEVQDAFNGKIAYLMLDVDTDIELAENYKINSFPTTMIFKNGERLFNKPGDISFEELKSELDAIII